MNMIKIGQYYFNFSAITWVIGREVFFNNGKSLILTQPEIDEVFAWLFNEPRKEEVTVVEEPLVVKKPTVKKAKK